MSYNWLITGAGGQFGSVLFNELLERGESVIGLASPSGPLPDTRPAAKSSVAPRTGSNAARSTANAAGRADASGEAPARALRLDITDFDALATAIHDASPRIIIHAAAVTNIAAAFEQPDLAQRVNVEATRRLAESAALIDARVVFISTDLVFDGTAAPYAEDAAPTPLSIYGRTKAEAERIVLGRPQNLVLRPPLMYGLPRVDRPATFVNQLRAIAGGDELRLFEDEFRTPISLADCVRSCIEAAESDVCGVLHVAGPQRLSRLEMGRIAAAALGVREPNIVAVKQASMTSAEPRPGDVSLSCERFIRAFGHAPGRPMAEAMREIAAAFTVA